MIKILLVLMLFTLFCDIVMYIVLKHRKKVSTVTANTTTPIFPSEDNKQPNSKGKQDGFSSENSD